MRTVSEGELLLLLTPSFLITCWFLVYVVLIKGIRHFYSGMGKRRHHSRITRFIASSLITIIFLMVIANFAGVYILYFFSKDDSFRKWPDGRPDLNQVMRIRNVWEPEGVNPDPSIAFADKADYLRQLKTGPRKQLDIRYAEALREGRTLLKKFKINIVESAHRNGMPPDIVATFVCANVMMKNRAPTYSLAGTTFHVVYRFFDWENKSLQKFIMKAMTDGIELDERNFLKYWTANRLLTVFNTPLQDGFWDVTGGVMFGGSPTMGVMQVRADKIHDVQFLEFLKLGQEKCVKQDALWARIGIDASGYSTRRINWTLLTDPVKNIEAGTAALRLSLEDCIQLQNDGDYPKMPVMPEFSQLRENQWMHTENDCLTAQKYGPDLLLELIARDPFPVRPVLAQRFTNCLSFSPARELPWLHIVVLASGLFDQSPSTLKFTGITKNNFNLLSQYARDKNLFIRTAALETMNELASCSHPELAERARSFLVDQ